MFGEASVAINSAMLVIHCEFKTPRRSIGHSQLPRYHLGTTTGSRRSGAERRCLFLLVVKLAVLDTSGRELRYSGDLASRPTQVAHLSCVNFSLGQLDCDHVTVGCRVTFTADAHKFSCDFLALLHTPVSITTVLVKFVKQHLLDQSSQVVFSLPPALLYRFCITQLAKLIWSACFYWQDILNSDAVFSMCFYYSCSARRCIGCMKVGSLFLPLTAVPFPSGVGVCWCPPCCRLRVLPLPPFSPFSLSLSLVGTVLS